MITLMQKSVFAFLTALLIVCFAPAAQAQKYFSRNAKVSFDATVKSSPEKIAAVSNSGTIVLDKSTGAVQTAVLLKGLLFEKTLMQEHFNENYVESSKYPKAEFKGKLENAAAVDFTKDGTYNGNLSGTMTLHGVTKDIKAPVTFIVKNGKINAKANFALPLADYNVEIPSLVADKVAKQANIEVSTNLDPMK